jgi:nitrate reductase delta subunit
MTITYKALAALLAYPTPELVAALPEMSAVVDRDPKLGRRERAAVRALVRELAASDLLDAQERYVALFDRGRATSLHLFEHVHGESRDRGQAMVDLNAVYGRAGLKLTANELPDYLPVMLEFLSTQPEEVSAPMIDDCAHILRKVGETLARRTSSYAAVFAAVLALAGQPRLETARVSGSETERSLDDEWIEEPVIFGPAAGASCGTKPGDTSIVKFMPRAGTPR